MRVDGVCHWGFETFEEGKKIFPKKGTVCMPFKHTKMSEEETEKHKKIMIAHVIEHLDRFQELFDKGII